MCEVFWKIQNLNLRYILSKIQNSNLRNIFKIFKIQISEIFLKSLKFKSSQFF